MKSLLCISLFLIFEITAHAADLTSPNETKLKIEQTKRQALQILDRKGFFKQGTCTDVANTFFESNGFPFLGQKDLIKGTRGNFDRGSANQEPPVFTDEFTLDGIKTSMTAVSSKEKKLQKWTLK